MTIAEILKAKGLDEDTIKGITDEMKANKVFTAGEENLDVRYNKLKTDHDGKIQELTEAQNLIAELKKGTKNNDDLQGKITAYETQVQQLQQELEQTKLEAAIKVELLSNKAMDIDYLTFKLKEKGELALDEQGHIKGWDDKIAALKTQFPTQFESADGKKNVLENKLPDADDKAGAISKEAFGKMGYQDRVKLFNESPETYNELSKQ